jgi:hypothetical protein
MATNKFLALSGAIGAVAPDVVLAYSKRFTMPEVTFEPSQYVLVTFIYMVLAAIVAVIFPYPNPRTLWKAFAVGAALPLIIAGLASAVPNQRIEPLGPGIQQPGTLLDLISIH